MTVPKAQVVPLAGHVLDANGPILRDHTRAEAGRDAHYLERYDRTTLFYDCVHLQDQGGYLFTAPRFLNLWQPFRNGLMVNGQRAKRVRRQTWLRCEQVFVPAPEGGLTVRFQGHDVPVTPRAAQTGRFTGQNTLVAVSKNNDLDWIAHWATFHARAHGAEGVVVFDNGSTQYDPFDVAERLGQLDELRAVTVYSAPYPYGPADKSGRFEVSPRFFQSAMLNLARRDALAGARAVLSVDIDELVVDTHESGGAVFDSAARHPLGMVTIQGHWVYPHPGTDGPAPQPEHTYRAVPNAKCNRKWCMTPRGPMSRLFGWAVHQIGGLLQNLFTEQKQFQLIHCRAASTGWKPGRFTNQGRLQQDPKLVALMARYLSE